MGLKNVLFALRVGKLVVIASKF